MKQQTDLNIRTSGLNRQLIDEAVKRETAGEADGIVTTITMPVARKGPETRQNAIRLKTCLGRAGDRLREAGADAEWIETLEEVEFSGDRWRTLQRYSAICLLADSRRDDLQLVGLRNRWPEMVVTGPSPWLRPLIQSYASPSDAVVLCLTLDEAWLLRVSDEEATEIDAGALPVSLEEAVGGDLEEPSLQHHNAGDQTRFHGQAVNRDDREDDMDRFLQRVESALAETLRTEADLVDLPLLGAGTDKVMARFEKISGRSLFEQIPGSPSRERIEEIADEARRQVGERRLNEAANRVANWRELENGSTTLTELVTAAHNGRVQELLVIGQAPAWGRVGDNLKVETHPNRRDGSLDLVDFALRHAWSTGAEISAVNEPTPQIANVQLAGLLRY